MVGVIEAAFATRAFRLAAPAVLALLLAGCGAGDAGRASVSGKVTYDGEPVKQGQIVFEPLGSGRLGIAQIGDGVFSMPPQQGPTPGKYTVRITAERPTGKTTQALASSGGGGSVDVYEQFIPAKFNERSELTTEFDEKSDNVRDFDLKSK